MPPPARAPHDPAARGFSAWRGGGRCVGEREINVLSRGQMDGEVLWVDSCGRHPRSYRKAQSSRYGSTPARATANRPPDQIEAEPTSPLR